MKSILQKMIKRESFFSYDLKTGGQIIGYIHLIAFILNILRLFYVLYEWGLSIWIEVTISGMLSARSMDFKMNENISDEIFSVHTVILLIVTASWLYGLHKVSSCLPNIFLL